MVGFLPHVVLEQLGWDVFPWRLIPTCIILRRAYLSCYLTEHVLFSSYRPSYYTDSFHIALIIILHVGTNVSLKRVRANSDDSVSEIGSMSIDF